MRVASPHFAAVMTGEIEVTGIEDRCLAAFMAGDGDLAVIDDQLVGRPQEVFEGVLVTLQEMLLGFAPGELQIHPATEAQDHDKEGKPAADGPDLDPTRTAPVHLGGLGRSELQTQVSRSGCGSHSRHKIPQEGRPAGVALLAQALEDLSAGIGVLFPQADNGALEGIEFAGPPGNASRTIGGACP